MAPSAPGQVADKVYRLNRDHTESVRLTSQHWILEQRQGWLLHPDIQNSLQGQSNPQIADVPAGNCIWTMRVAEEMPNATVTALDISEDQYPQRWTAPDNITFGQYDLLADVPPQYQNRFDVVHCRLLLMAGPRVDKSVFISKFVQLLKPGGWLQWDELAYPATCIVKPPQNTQQGEDGVQKLDGDSHQAVETMLKLNQAEDVIGWINEIDQVFGEAGLVDTKKTVLPMKRSLLKYETALITEVFGQMAEALSTRPNVAASAADAMSRATHDMEENYANPNGKMFSYNFVVGVGRKA